MTTPRIDAHVHLWRYDPQQYDWIDETMSALRCDFLPEDLAGSLESAHVDGIVAVQARQSLAETEFLLAMAEKYDTVRGVVGWAPLADENFPEIAEQFRGRPKLRGLRHVVQAEVDDEYLLRADFNRGIRYLRDIGLAYDILIFERHLPVTIRFVDQHPDQVFILDHLAKPRIAAQEQEPWATHMKELARRPNVFCKVSGLLTEDDWIGRPPGFGGPARLGAYLDVVVEAFGADRLIAASDWPVCLLGATYTQWFDYLRGYFGDFSQEEQAAIFGGNAVHAYRLPA